MEDDFEVKMGHIKEAVKKMDSWDGTQMGIMRALAEAAFGHEAMSDPAFNDKVRARVHKIMRETDPRNQ